MMRWKKTLVISAMAVASLILAAYLALLSLDFNRFKPQIIQAVKEASGLDVAIHGSIEIGLGINLGVVIHNIDIRNAAWGSRPESVRVRRCEVNLALLRLLRGALEIDRLFFVEPDFLLETNPSGEFNFRRTPSKEVAPLAPASQPRKFTFLPVREVRVEKGRFTYRNGETGARFSKEVDHLALSASSMQSPIHVDLEGSISDSPVRVEGILGSPAQLIDAEKPWPLEISADLDGSVATVQGTIRDVARLKGLSLKAKAEGLSLKKVLGLAGIPLPSDPGPFAFSALLSDEEAKLMLKDIDLRVGTPESQEIKVSGTIADLISQQGIQLEYQAQCKDLSKITGPSKTPIPVRGPFAVSGRIADSAPKVFRFADIHFAFGKQGLTGSALVDMADRILRIKLEISTPELDLGPVLASGAGDSPWVRALRGFGPLALKLSATDPFGNPGIEELDFHAGTAETVEFKVTGSVRQPLALQGIQLFYRLGGKDAGSLEKLIGRSVPLKGLFFASGRFVHVSQGVLTLDPIEFALEKNRVSGMIELILEGEKPRLKAKLSTQNLGLDPVLMPGFVNPHFLRILSDLGPIDMTFTISDPAGMPALHEANAVIGTEDMVEVKIGGSIHDLLTFRGIDLRFDIGGKNAAHLGRILGERIPIKGPFTLTGHARDPKPGTYRLEDLRAVLGKNEIGGWVESRLGQDPLRIGAEFSSKSIDLDILDPKGTEHADAIRDLGPWSLGTGIAFYADRLSVESLHVVLGTRDLAEAMAAGVIDDLFAWQGVDLQCSLKGKELSGLLELFGTSIPMIGAFDISGRLIDPRAGTYKVQGFEARFGDNDLAGSFDLDLAEEKPRLTADISSQKLDLRPLFAKPKQVSESKTGKIGKPREKIFPADPLPLEHLEVMNAKVVMTAGQILLPRLALDAVSAGMALEHGHLEIHPFQCAVGGGTVEGRLDLKAGSGKPAAALELRAERIDIGAMLDELGLKKPFEGILGVDIAVASEGDSISTLMAGLNGRFVSVQREGRIHSRYMDMIGGGLIQEILRIVNPFSAKEEHSELNCAVDVFDIRDGLATCKTSLADTRHTTLRGRGEVDLKEEKLDLLFALSPKKGIGISGVAEVGVSLPGLARSFKLGGTLAQPSLTINPGGAAGTIGKMLGGLALLGPFGLAAGLLDLKLGEKDPCFGILKAMDDGDYSSEALEKESQTEKPAPLKPFSEEHQGP